MIKKISIILLACFTLVIHSVLLAGTHKTRQGNNSFYNSDSLIIKVKKNGWTKNNVDSYSRYILNNKISIDNEIKTLDKLDKTFYSKYLFSLLLKKQMKFDRMYEELHSIFKPGITYLPYFDEFIFSARASNNLENLLKEIEKKDNPLKDYLLSLINYAKGKYEKSLAFLNSYLQNHKTQPLISYKLSYIYRNLGDYPKAFSALKKIKGDGWIIDKKLLAEGSLSFLSGNYNKALALYRKGFDIANKINDNQTKAIALVDIAILDDMSGNTGKARTGFSNAITLANNIGDYETKAFALSEMGVSFTFTSQLIDARENYLDSFEIYKLTNNNYRLALIANNIGKLYMRLFEYNSAMKFFNEGIKYSGSNKRSLAMNLLGIADAYTNLSDYSKALKYYKKAGAISSQIKELSLTAEINSGLGALNFNINNADKALEYYKKSIKFYEITNDTYSKADIYQKLGRVYISLDQLNKASESIRAALILSKKDRDSYNEALAALDLSEIYFIQNKTKKASLALRNVSPTIIKNNFDYLKARQYVLQGKIDKQKKLFNKAKADFLNALKIAERLKEYNLQIEALYLLAKINERINEPKKAGSYFAKANDLIIKISNPLFTNTDVQISYYSSKENVYNAYADFLIKHGNYKKAFELIDNSRSRNTQQTLDDLKIRSLIKDKQVLNKLYDYSWMLSSGLYNSGQIDSIKTKLYALKSRISKSIPGLKNYFKNNNVLSLSQIQNGLEDDENIISLYSSKDRTYLFYINKYNFNYYTINLTRSELLKLIQDISPYYNSKINNRASFNQDLFSFNTKAAYNLFKKVFSPVLRNIPKGEKIIFSPSFNVQSFPIEFLVTKYDSSYSDFSYSDKNFLIFDYSVLYTSSAHTYLKQKENNLKNNGKVLVVGDPFINNKSNEFATRRSLLSKTAGFLPLKYSLQEINDISNIIHVDKTLEGNKATETNFKLNAGNSKLIHLSTHSFLDDKQPVIFFSNENDKKNDGFLELNEIVGLHLNSDLVVLSSCSSGLGKVDKSEGVLGMTKAFFEAGAKSVMVSLWEVNDKYTSQLMKYFYEYLSEGKSKSDALRLAKIKFIKKGSPNPYFWSAFVIWGNNQPVKLKEGFHFKDYTLFITGILLIFFLAILVRIKRKKRVAV